MLLNPIAPRPVKLAVVIFGLLGLIGCNGATSRNSQAVPEPETAPATAPPASLSFTASDTVLDSGESVTLSWTSSNADSCEASGDWGGVKSLSGAETIGPLVQDANFTLSCSGDGGGAIRQLSIQIDDGGGVTVVLDVSPQQIAAGDVATLSWSSTNATQCTASGGWTGEQLLDGSFIAGPLTVDTSFQLTCQDSNDSAMAMVSVTLIDKTLRWQAPTQNVDGSTLTDLAGYRIYWGLSSRNYVDNHTINSPLVTQWEATVPAGEYYFALTAFDSEDNESAYSNEVLKAIP